jgi:hypothetical protein
MDGMSESLPAPFLLMCCADARLADDASHPHHIYQQPDPSKKFFAKKVDKQSNGLGFFKFLNASQPKSNILSRCIGRSRHNRRCGLFSCPISDHPDERAGDYADDDDRSQVRCRALAKATSTTRHFRFHVPPSLRLTRPILSVLLRHWGRRR